MAHEQARTTGAVVGSLAVLLLAAPRPQDAVRTLVDVSSGTDPSAPVVAAAALLAWAVAGWLALTVLLVLLSRLPGLLGPAVGVLARRVAPAAVRRAVEAALGLTVAVSALAPSAALAAPVAGSPLAAVSADSTWDLDWPDASAPPALPVLEPRTAAPTPVIRTAEPRPSASAPPAARAPAPAPPRGAAPVTAPVTAPATAPRPVQPGPAAVVVRAGDSLWSVAEASLRRSGAAPTDRQVAQAWPRWWAANREAVGDDPDLLLPGTVLRAPDTPARS